jgi:hypothetical protein
VLGCAWRIVILRSSHREADNSDASNLQHFCGSDTLDVKGRQAAEAQSRALLDILNEPK